MHKVSPWRIKVSLFPNWIKVRSSRSLILVLFKKSDPIRKSLFPGIKKILVFNFWSVFTTELNWLASSPIQYSKRSPRMNRKSCLLAWCSKKPLNLSITAGESSLKWISETNSALVSTLISWYFLNNYGLNRNILMIIIWSSLDRVNFINNVKTFSDFTKNTVTSTILAGIV